jgi:hypothetical protein
VPEHLTLPPTADSVPAARRFVCDRLTALGAAAACDDAETLVSELATNAVLHARTEFTVEVSRAGETIRVRVGDLSVVLPRQRSYGTGSTTGRGMRLIASVAAAWGVDGPISSGKAVWFELPADGNGAFVPAWEDDEMDVDALLASFGDSYDDAGPPSAPRAAA